MFEGEVGCGFWPLSPRCAPEDGTFYCSHLCFDSLTTFILIDCILHHLQLSEASKRKKKKLRSDRGSGRIRELDVGEMGLAGWCLRKNKTAGVLL